MIKIKYKNWKKFTWDEQEKIISIHDVILIDVPPTLKDRLKYYAAKFTKKNFDKGLMSFNQLMDQFSDMKIYKDGNKKDYSSLLGKSTKKDYSFITGRKH